MGLGPERRGVLLPGARAGMAGGSRWWLLLGVLLLALLVGALTFDPFDAAGGADGGAPTSDAATIWMQAASLAHDLNLGYAAGDTERFVADWGTRPEGLRLRSRDAGDHIAFDVPVPYSVFLAPFVGLAPVRGAAVANVLLLALAAVVGARVLARRLGSVAPLWVAVSVFASVTFTYAFRIGPELFALAAVVSAYALVYRGEGPASARMTEVYSGSLPGEARGGVGRWLGAGALLALAAASHPAYLLLALPLVLAAPRVLAAAPVRRRRAAALVGAALLALLALVSAVGHAAGDDWLPWSTRGRVFLTETGFPAVDTPVSAWPKGGGGDEGAAAGESPAPGKVGRLLHGMTGLSGGDDWLPGGAPRPVWDLGLWGWNLLFLVAGRTVGVLPYFLPVVLLLGAALDRGGRVGSGRLAIPWMVVAALAVWLAVRPFDFAGAAGGLGGPGNHWFVPLYGALWFVAVRPVRPAWALVVAAVAAPFLYPSWLAPRTVAQPAALRAGTFVSPVAARLLPSESTQRDLPGTREVQLGVLWIRSTGPGITVPDRGEHLIADTSGHAELLVGSPVPLGGLRLAFGAGAPTRIELDDATLVQTTLTPAGGVVFTVDPGSPDRTQPLWWTRGDVFLYRLGFAFPGGSGEASGSGTTVAASARVPLTIQPVYREDS